MRSTSASLSLAYVLCLVAVLALTAWVYQPGQYGPPMLDDRGSLLKLDSLQEHPERAREYIFGDGSGALGRPVSMASFVFEKLYWEGGSGRTKAINIGLHLANGVLITVLFSLLLAHLGIPASRWFSLLGGALWLLSPLYVSTVLYMVQRMTILATFFMLAASLCYIFWRNAVVARSPSWHFLLLLILFFLLALFSKENAIVLLPVLVLMEVFWFQGANASGKVHRGLRRASHGLLAVGTVAAVGLLIYGTDWIMAGFTIRDFSLSDRLLTESRILWDYVGQLYMPEHVRMGLFHDDVIISRTLMQPISTLYAVAAWAALGCAILALWFARIAWAAVFTVLWFLVGHSIESTVLALELYFEHRNYFPGIGLFLLPIVTAGLLCKRYTQVVSPLLVLGCFYVLWLASQTSSQVEIWSSTPLLRLNNVVAHPDSARANEEMALQMASVGAIESALEYSSAAGELDSRTRVGDRQLRDLSLYCLARTPVPQSAFETLGQSNPERPFAVVSIFKGLMKLLQGEDCPGFDRLALAERLEAIFLSDPKLTRASANFYSVLAGYENDLGRFDNALAYTGFFLAQSPDNTRGLLMKLHFATALGKVSAIDESIQLLQKKRDAGQLSSSEKLTLALYLEN